MIERLHRYRFRRVWNVPASPETTYRALHDLDEWRRWWPQIRATRRLDDDRATVVIRSVLPYDLRLLLVRRRDDPAALVLEAGIEGDLRGFARFRFHRARDGTRMLFEQDVEARKPLMRWLAPVARPLFRLNHRAMMRSGERGLRDFLSGTARSRP